MLNKNQFNVIHFIIDTNIALLKLTFTTKTT